MPGCVLRLQNAWITLASRWMWLAIVPLTGHVTTTPDDPLRAIFSWWSVKLCRGCPIYSPATVATPYMEEEYTSSFFYRISLELVLLEVFKESKLHLKPKNWAWYVRNSKYLRIKCFNTPIMKYARKLIAYTPHRLVWQIFTRTPVSN